MGVGGWVATERTFHKSQEKKRSQDFSQQSLNILDDTLTNSFLVEKGHLAPSNLTFLLIAIDTNGFRRMKEEEQIYKTRPQIF